MRQASRLRLAARHHATIPRLSSSAFSSTSLLSYPRRPSTATSPTTPTSPNPENGSQWENVQNIVDRVRESTNSKLDTLASLTSAEQVGGPPSGDPEEPTEKRPRIRRTRAAVEKEKEAQLPPRPSLSPDLLKSVLWEPESAVSAGDSISAENLDASRVSSSSSNATGSPPSYVIEEALGKLVATLHPRTQLNGLVLPENDAPAVEPTLTLYCPIEGGNSVIDETIKSLARAVGADVVVLDAVQLAAGVHGAFGEAALAFKFPSNPLHTSRKATQPPPASPSDDDMSPNHQIMAAMPVHIGFPGMGLGGSGLRPSRTSPLSGKKQSEGLKMRYFFDAVLNAPETVPIEEDIVKRSRPRLLYIRDFDLLAGDTAEWYPHLLAAVQAHRQGNQSSEAVMNPTTIVLGVSPPLQVYHPAPAATKTSPAESDALSSSNDEENGKQSRERELKSWLRQWDQFGDAAIREELPWFTAPSEPSPSRSGPEGGFRVFSPDGQGIPEGLPRFIRTIISSSAGGDGSRDGPSTPDAGYFTVAAVIPETRNVEHEAMERTRRRRTINKLAFRMALGNAGATVPGQLDDYISEVNPASETVSSDSLRESPQTAEKAMFLAWERSLVDKDVLDEVAVRAVGLALTAPGSTVLSDSVTNGHSGIAPQLTEISWDTVAIAWQSYHRSEQQRKQWIAHQRKKGPASSSLETSAPTAVEFDDVVESVKADPSLDTHEKRLLGCIVDTVSMPTTFASVHLPFKTVDAIRTMVSLPLLYPQAFNEGVLKNHSMTGALLLGPPGVGKTLMARAVAKESGARMLMIKPSDVMDMYVGEGEKLVKSVFSLARRLSPCVVFLDEVDALLASRVSSRESGSAIAHRSVITEFMQEMDGLKTNKSQGNVIVIGATNRPFDLDDAVLRRLPRRLLIDLPGEKERLAILGIHLRDEILSPDVDLRALAKKTEMYSGSDLKNLVVATALDAIKESVDLPWASGAEVSEPESQFALTDPDLLSPRILYSRHFDKALSEITPSSSESLGTLHDLRKWNEEFGEGRAKSGGKKSKWGLKFGFGGKDGTDTDGHVLREQSAP